MITSTASASRQSLSQALSQASPIAQVNRKCLYRQTNLPDNLVDQHFLQDLRCNVNVRSYGFMELVMKATVIVQHVCSVCMFLCIFIFRYQGAMGLSSLLLLDGLIALLILVLSAFYLVAFARKEDVQANGREFQINGSTFNLAENQTSPIRQQATDHLNQEKDIRDLLHQTVTTDNSTVDPLFKNQSTDTYSIESVTFTETSDTVNPSSLEGSDKGTDRCHTSTPSWTVLLLGLKTYSMFTCILLGLAPILKTLTEDTSSDTIWALAAVFFFLNMVFHDYARSDGFPGPVALNAVICGSVVLASRLPGVLDVFALVALAIMLFAFLPVIKVGIARERRQRLLDQQGTSGNSIVVQKSEQNDSESPNVKKQFINTMASVALNLYFCGKVSRMMLWVVASLHVVVGLVCPFWLVCLQRYKKRIGGPWDEAKVTSSASVHGHGN